MLHRLKTRSQLVGLLSFNSASWRAGSISHLWVGALGRAWIHSDAGRDAGAAAATTTAQGVQPVAVEAPPDLPTNKIHLLGLPLSELQDKLLAMGLEKYRAQQIFNWVYRKGATSFDVMTDIKLDVRERLKETFELVPARIRTMSQSTDGTRKWLVEVAPQPGKGQVIETVFIPNVGVPSLHDAALPSPNASRYVTSKPTKTVLKVPLSKSDADHTGVDHDAIAQAFKEIEVERGSVCVSSQVGCSLRCAFCHTGTMPKSELRNLTAAEIVGQVMMVKHEMGDYVPQAAPTPNTPLRLPDSSVTNIVLMGMGEPGYNYRNVKAALSVLLDPNGLAFGKRRITLSTSGVVPVIDRLGEELNVNLAISLHAVRDELRDVLVPINKTYPLKMLMEACRRYPGVKNNRVVTWEYVMLEGVNDTIEDARELVRLLKGIPSLVNLIPFNPWPGSKFKTSSMNRIRRFQQEVLEGGDGLLKCSIRTPRGRDILAACGQLAVINNANKQLSEAIVSAESQ